MPPVLGLALDGADAAAQLEQALEAEALGCESIWLDASVVPNTDAFAALGRLAAATKRVRLGTLSHDLVARHPLVSARAIATLDRESAGRFELGLAGVEGPALGEAITLCKKLFCDPSVEYRGASFTQDEIALEPKPAQKPWPPIHLAATSDVALNRVARMSDGWIAVGHTPASIVAPLETLRAQRARAETLDGRFQVSACVGSCDQAELERWREAGVDRLIVPMSVLRQLG